MVLLLAVAIFGTVLSATSSGVEALIDDINCPTGSTCIPPLRCTMILDWRDLAFAAESMRPHLDRIYHRCRISAKFEGICCQTGGSSYPDNNDDHGSDGDTIKSATTTMERNTTQIQIAEGSGGFLRFLPDESNNINHGRKIHKRAVSSYEQFNGFSTYPSVHTRSKRCVLGPECFKKHLRYRRLDGRCNNVGPGNSLWGSAGYPMERILPPAYGDGIWSPRVLSSDGRYLPSARSISALLFSDLHVPHEKYNVLMMQFGQFLVHDITKNKVFSEKAKCCLEDGSHRLPVPHPACFPIHVSYKDPFYSQFGVKCLEFVRTAIASRSRCQIGHGRQISTVTHFVDGSGIYGNTVEEAHQLRAHEGGRLKSLKHRRTNNDLPPQNTDEDACEKKADMCFKVGDDRVNQIITLVAIHTIFLREHNRIASALEELNPHWGDETLYQESRRIVTAELQHIVYNEYLPKIVGPHFMDKYDLHASKGFSHFYNSNNNPSITSEFSSAAFRFGHSTVPGQLELPGGIVNTHNTFFNPTRLREPHYIDELFRGILLQPMQKVDDTFTHSLTWFLNPKEGRPYGKDLVSINIQRGRDHAVQSYNHYLHLSGRKLMRNFKDFGSVLGPKLAQLYATPDDVDLYVGGILEHPVPGGVVGATFAEIISDQFARLKEGDRYFYSNGPPSNPGHFTHTQLEELQKVTLAGVLCANANDKRNFEVQLNAFSVPHAASNPLLSCRSDKMIKLNLKWWKD